MNDRSVEEVVEQYGSGRSTYLIPPVQVPLQDSYSDTPSSEGWMLLPAVTIVAELESNTPVGDINESGWDKSHVTVIWYQDTWAFPIDPDVLEQILLVDWDSLASNIVMPY